MAKIRGEVEAKINASQVSFDSKVNFFTYEVDRLQKLLTIRPTTSELQQVRLFFFQKLHRILICSICD